MGLKRKQMQTRQKAYIEQNLQNRLAFLSGKGIEARRIDRDPLVRGLRANVKAVNVRLRRIADDEKRTEEMTKIKAERAAGPRKEADVVKVEKPKKAPVEGKVKKAKEEKKAAPPKTQESGKD